MKYIDLNRIEFVITNACSGQCRHCSEGERLHLKGGIDADIAADAVHKLTGRFKIESIMTFGGEPLLLPEAVCAIHKAARDCGVLNRQLITNGYFAKDERRINEVAKALYEAGVNDILISADVFHQEFIPIEPVMIFTESLREHGVPIKIHPAWVVNETHENPYNAETKRLLKLFAEKGFEVSGGNNIFPSRAALKHLDEYFSPPGEIDYNAECGTMPYSGRLDEITCFGINPNGDVRLCSPVIGNIYEHDILSIVDNYNPYEIPAMNALLHNGVAGLLSYANERGIEIDASKSRTACGVCRKVMEALKEQNGQQKIRA